MATIYVGKKAERGVAGSKDPTIANTKNINATSGSMNKIGKYSAKEFSPMLLGPVVEKDIFGGAGELVAQNFENYWQYGKIFQELGHVNDNGELTEKWYNFRTKGYAKVNGDRHPEGTKSNEVKFVDKQGKKHYKYYTAISSMYMNTILDYIDSRKQIYAPIYAWLVVQTDAYNELANLVAAGQNIQILDYDVLPGSHKVTVEFLRERINDPSKPFGHGYVLAGLLAGIDPSEYCN